jgi:hypothetical protein
MKKEDSYNFKLTQRVPNSLETDDFDLDAALQSGILDDRDSPTITDEDGSDSSRGSYLRAAQAQDKSEYGKFEYEKTVLSWPIVKIAKTNFLGALSPLPAIFRDDKAYNSAFIPLILEETRTILARGLALLQTNPPAVTQLKFEYDKKPKYAANFDRDPTEPCELKFSVIAVKSSDLTIIAEDAFILRHIATNTEFLAIANYVSRSSKTSMEIGFKVIIKDQKLREQLELKSQDNQWQVKPIGSLVTYKRMYEACVTKPATFFQKALLKGEVATCLSTPLMKELNESSFSQGLNPSQCEAIKTFLTGNNPLQFIQGPPGTGKTTTIVELLTYVYRMGKKILVTAPSNKAVQLLAQRFLEKCPKASAVLVGVEEKLSQGQNLLENIVLSTWRGMFAQRVKKLQQEIINLKLPDKLFSRDNYEILKQFLNEQSGSLLSQLTIIKTIIEDIRSNYVKKYQLDDIEPFEYEIEVARFHVEELDTLLKESPNSQHDLDSLVELLKGLQSNQIEKKFADYPSQIKETDLLSGALVVFATLSICGRKSFKDAIQNIDVLIVDEAGQSIESETLIPFCYQPERCVFVGDTKQLPATVMSSSANATRFGRSLMSRLVDELNYPCIMLDTQYRMHSEIARWPSEQFYQNRLKNATSEENHNLPSLKHVPKYLDHYSFINIVGTEEENEQNSFFNSCEAQAMLLLIRTLQNSYGIDPNKQISVITFYKAQVNYLNNLLSRHYPKIKIQTVEGSQGDENDIVLISFVRANPKGNVGFVDDFQRLNVALTRARYLLVMLGYMETLLKKGGTAVSSLIQNVQKRSRVFEGANVLFKASSNSQATSLNYPNSITNSNAFQGSHQFVLPSNSPHKAGSGISLTQILATSQVAYGYNQYPLSPTNQLSVGAGISTESMLADSKAQQKNEATSNDSKQKNKDTNVIQADINSSKKTAFCTFFQAGRCTRGTNCRFIHAMPNSKPG